MKPRTPSLHSHSLYPYHRFLKPGALARLRDSRISAKSHRGFLPLCLPDSQSLSQQMPFTITDQFPFFPERFYGPTCLKRKKFVANKNVLFASTRTESVSESPEIVIAAENSVVVN